MPKVDFRYAYHILYIALFHGKINKYYLIKNGSDFMPIPQAAKPDPPASAKTLVFSTLQEWIVSGTLQPGERIIDSELAEYFSVSRTPIREALQMLNTQGLVDVIPSNGTRVSEIDWNDVKQNYEALTEMNCVIARMVINQINPTHVRDLKRLNDNFSQAINSGDIQKQSQCDKDFHNYLIGLANNNYIARFIEHLSISAQRIENLYFAISPRRKESVSEHEEIINCLSRHDIEATEKAIRNNWVTGVEMYQYFKAHGNNI